MSTVLNLISPASYQFNIFAVPVFFTALATALLGGYVLFRERLSPAGVAFFLMTLAAGIWLFAFTGMYLASSKTAALVWAKMAYLGLPFLPSAIYYFTTRVLRLHKTFKKEVYFSFFISSLFAGVIVSSDAMIRDLYHYSWGFYPKYEWPSVIYLIFFFGVMLRSLQHYRAESRKPQSEERRKRIQLFFLAFSIAYIASLDYLPKFGIALYPFGYAGILGFVVVTAMAMKRYRLVDITPSFAAEQILSAMGDALLVLDGDDIVRVANRSACELFGLPRAGLIGKHISAVSGNFPAKNTLASLENIGAEHAYELRHEPVSGEKLILNVTESFIKDHLGCVIATALVIRDVTALKNTEKELEEAKKRCAELYHEMPEAVIILDEFGRFHSVNPAAEELLGFKEKQLTGKIFVMSNILPSAEMGEVLKVIRQVMEGYPQEPFDLELARIDTAELCFVKAYPSALRQDGRVVAVQMILRDMTQEKKFEKALVAARHELKQRIEKQLEELARNHQDLKSEIEKIRLTE